MGDRALSAVIKTLVFGSRVPATNPIQSPLISAETVADAAILVCPLLVLILLLAYHRVQKQIMRALCEWVDDSYINLSQPSSNMALRFEGIRQEILVKVKDMWKGSPSRSLHLFR